jgi:peptidylprolyl isomerase
MIEGGAASFFSRLRRKIPQRTTSMTQAKRGDTVRINYTGRLTDGTQFDSSEGREPLQLTLGAGQVISGLESHVDGMEVGSRDTVTIPADDAYGPRREEAVQTVERASIPENIDLAVGTQLQARTPDGRVVPLTVVAVDDARVQLDANHPLAGQDLVFDVELVEIVEAA